MNMNKKIFATIAMGVLSMMAVSCDKDSSDTPTPKPETVETLNGSVKDNMTLDASKEYKLDGTLYIKAGATLTIPAGTTITATEGFDRYIIVERDGKINIQGTASKPVKMTSVTKKSGAWGGLVINGRASLTSSQAEAETEINPLLHYGPGMDKNKQPLPAKDDDNSGSISYLIIEYAGAAMNDNQEHNGLTLNAVGRGTKIENVYIYKSADDGVEFFGGSVEIKNLLVVDADDDMFDFTQGYSGALHNAYGIWNEGLVSTEKDPRGVEADGNHDGNFAGDSHQSTFTIDNLTIELNMKHSTDKGYFMDDVFKVRRGATVTIKNALVKGQGGCKNFIDVKDGSGVGFLTIDYKNELKNKPLSEVIVGEVNATENEKATGAEKSAFSWTGYKF